MEDRKTCTRCKQEKPLSAFHRNNRRSDGHSSACKECTSALNKKYVPTKLERRRAKCKDRPILSKEEKSRRIREGMERARTISKEEVLQKKRKYTREYMARRYKEDINFKIANRIRNRLCCAVKSKTRIRSVERLGIPIADFKVYIESLFQPGMSWDNYGEWHIDHIIPLSSFNLLDEADLDKACHYTNMQPLWAADNIRKGGHPPSQPDEQPDEQPASG